MFAENGIQLTMKHCDCLLITWYCAHVSRWTRIRFDSNMVVAANDYNHCIVENDVIEFSHSA